MRYYHVVSREDEVLTCIRSNPCHIEMILTEGAEVVQKAPEAVARAEGKHLNSRQRAQRVRRAITQG